MKCCRCNTEFGSKAQTCPACGIPLKEYTRLMHLANACYNNALEAAADRDLSKAILLLKRCLELNKRQIQARNLYGLILYEIGEFGQAARQWKLSMAFAPEDPQAKELYKKAFGNRNEVAKCLQAAQKYNQALRCAREGALDLAAVQLKKVLGMFPRYAKAARLMALICIEQGDYARASRVLKPVLLSNKTDIQAQQYKKEAEIKGGGMLKAQVKEQEERELRESQDVIIPAYSEKNELLHDFLCILGGLILGVLACMFLVFPSVKRNLVQQSNNQVMSYGQDLEAREVTIMNMQDEIDALNKELKETQNSLKVYTGENGILDAYSNLLSTMTEYYINKDYLKAAQALTAIDASAVDNSVFQSCYEMMNTDIEQNGLQLLYEEGMNLYKHYQYKEARKYFRQCLKIKKDYPEVYYWMGLCFYNEGDRENAQKYFYRVQKDYPETTWAGNSRNIMPYTEPEE